MLRFALLIALAAPAAAEGLDWLVGEWRGGGTHMGKPSTAALEVKPALGGKFVELSYRISAPFSFEGRAFYSAAGGDAWKANWFDSRGVAFSIDAIAASDTLTSEWKGSERGCTIYRRLGDGRLEVVDAVQGKDGTLREFARQTFTRAR